MAAEQRRSTMQNRYGGGKGARPDYSQFQNPGGDGGGGAPRGGGRPDYSQFQTPAAPPSVEAFEGHLVVIRHGERLDYAEREAGNNWGASAEQPWDPPLTPAGLDQAARAGARIAQVCGERGISLPKLCYTSPLQRCGQTICQAAGGLACGLSSMRIEAGLVESSGEDWYRSWAVPGADSTWGGPAGCKSGVAVAETELHPAALQPAMSLLNSPEAMEDKCAGCEPQLSVDRDYMQLGSMVMYNWSRMETEGETAQRLKRTAEQLLHAAQGNTVLVCTHGGPSTFLFTQLTGESEEAFGPCGYTAFSIYKYSKAPDGAVVWTKIVVNDVEHLGGEVLGGVTK